MKKIMCIMLSLTLFILLLANAEATIYSADVPNTLIEPTPSTSIEHVGSLPEMSGSRENIERIYTKYVRKPKLVFITKKITKKTKKIVVKLKTTNLANNKKVHGWTYILCNKLKNGKITKFIASKHVKKSGKLSLKIAHKKLKKGDKLRVFTYTNWFISGSGLKASFKKYGTSKVFTVR